VIVRKSQRHVEPYRRFAGEEIDRLGPGGQERIDARGIEGVAGLVAQIGPRLLRIFDDAPGPRQRRIGNPQPAAPIARWCRRSAAPSRRRAP
jgi:hypothetical protein